MKSPTASSPNGDAIKPKVQGQSKGRGTGLMVMVPEDTLLKLRMKAAAEGTTVRALVLDALDKAGYKIPDDEIIDRRRSRVRPLRPA